MYFGPLMFFDESYNLVKTTTLKGGKPTDKMQINTMIFTTYIWMNLFNQINSRVVED